jgi:dienelactone hydrolase
VRYLRGVLTAGDEQPEFFLALPEGATAASKVPFVLCLPILAGGDDLLWAILQRFAERGYAAGWVRRLGSALKPGQRSHDLEILLRRTVAQDRAFLTWVRRQPEIDAGRTAMFGISFGGMVATAILAVDPDIRAAAVCISGADLADLVHVSSEGRAKSWVRWRATEDGLGRSELTREIDREALSDPARLGVYVATERVLLIGARYDTVIPGPFEDLLWESLGRPSRYTVPFGHYSSGIALGSVLSRADEFFRARFDTR